MTLAEQLIENSKSKLKLVQIYQPAEVESSEEAVIQEETTDPTPE